MRIVYRHSLLALMVMAAYGQVAVVTAQQNPDGRVSLTSWADPYLMLMRDPEVYEQLGLSGRQREALRAASDELDVTLWSLRNQPSEASAKGFQELTATAERRVASILTEVQRARLDQIRNWILGATALLRDDVASRLTLDGGQRAEIQKHVDDFRNESQRLQQQTGGEQGASLAAEVKQRASDLQRRLMAILETHQRSRLREVFGEPLDGTRLGYVKFKAPELAAGGKWLNSQPLTMTQLKGKVVALHFWAFG